MTMLDKAARALSDHFKCEWETMRDDDREMIRGYARVVLMAVREPSDAIVEASEEYEGCGCPCCITAHNWQLMIDAILNEGAKTNG